ncbi:hypothetical protein PRK78_000319 [Emydomyces testavorans]|uniref:Uncharacterized protein n=1 Tax=Emydomyces testavorans TaxID=2070801 RepID=A0AAF0DC96_9EURO|nr:hypothetical protein PRK78_000319 [Emydomyces testavorans]
MESPPSRLLNCPKDVLFLVIEQLLDDKTSLCQLSLANKSFRQIVLPFLLRDIDISSHNNGRLPECEDEIRPEVYADFGGEYRPTNLVSRQRAFLQLITDRPELALLVQSFTWTLTWAGEDDDDNDDELTEIDLELWNVFSRLVNVQRLDLASLPEIDGSRYRYRYIRENPQRLFPAVIHLRLLGWMHRGLADAIITAINPMALRTVCLDYLQDEGAFPDGNPISDDVAQSYARHYRNIRNNKNYRDTISEELYKRQQSGLAVIFPGPMWTVLRKLSSRGCTALTRFELRIAPFDWRIDLRNYFTCFEETAKFLTTVKETLRSLTIVFGETCFFCYDSACGTSRYMHRITCQWNLTLAADFLHTLLRAHNLDFKSLDDVTLQGFHRLETDENNLSQICGLSREYLFAPGETIIRETKIDWRPVFSGYCYLPELDTIDRLMKLRHQS